MSLRNLSLYRTKEEDRFVRLKRDILVEAFDLDRGSKNIDFQRKNPIPSESELILPLEKMFESLGVQGVGEMLSFSPRDAPLREKYRVFGHEFIELYSNSLGDSTHLLVGNPSQEFSRCSALYDLIVVTNPVKARDKEEFKILHSIVSKLDADKGFSHIYDTERPGAHYNVNRTIQFHQTLNKKTITSPDGMIKKAFAIPPAYAAYVRYQRQRDKVEEGRIEGIVAGILG